MTELVQLLHRRFGTNEHLSIYSHELFVERTPEDEVEIFAQQTQLAQQIAAYGYKNHKWGLQKDIKLNHCMADGDGGVVIAPDGHLGKCEQDIDSNFFGHIDSEEHDEAILHKFKERLADMDACTTCFCYPQCIRLTMCEPEPTICTPGNQQYRLSAMRENMKYEYERYLHKNDKEQDDETEI